MNVTIFMRKYIIYNYSIISYTTAWLKSTQPTLSMIEPVWPKNTHEFFSWKVRPFRESPKEGKVLRITHAIHQNFFKKFRANCCWFCKWSKIENLKSCSKYIEKILVHSLLGSKNFSYLIIYLFKFIVCRKKMSYLVIIFTFKNFPRLRLVKLSLLTRNFEHTKIKNRFQNHGSRKLKHWYH